MLWGDWIPSITFVKSNVGSKLNQGCWGTRFNL